MEKISKDVQEEIKKLYREGCFMWEIARKLGISEHKVVITLLDSGLYHPGEEL